MNKLTCISLLAVSTLLLGGCSEDNGGLLGDAKGGIALNVKTNSSIITSEVVSSRAATPSATPINTEDLTLRVSSTDGSYSETWDLSEFPNDQEFKIGEYTVEAFYGEEGEEGFEKPYYHDYATVKIIENEITPINLTASVKNSLVLVTFDEKFKKYYSNYSATLSTSDKSFFISAKENRPVYVNPGSVTVTVSMTTPQGKDVKVKSSPFRAKAHTGHQIILTVDPDVANANVVISYDDTVDMVDEIINLDDLDTAPEPTIVTEGFNSGETISVIEGSEPDNYLRMNLIGRAGISSVKLTTSSPYLRQHGWPANIELVRADSETQALLTALGMDIRGLFKNVDKMAYIDFTNLCKQLGYIDGGTNQSVFTVTLTDRFDRATEPVSLTIKTAKALYEFDEFEPLYYFSPDVVFTFLYNGTNLEKNVKFFYQNDRGTFTQAEYASVTNISGNTYKIHILVPPHEHDLTIKGEYGDKQIPEVVIPRVGSTLTADERNVFSKHAVISIAAPSRAGGEAKIYNLESDGTFTPLTMAQDPNGYRLNGLTPATSYKLVAEVDGIKSNAIEITTETETPLPAFATLEENNRGSAGSNPWIEYRVGDGTIWGTNNPMTTSEGDNFLKNRISGTIPTGDGHNDANAVLLRTVGWGSGNQALGSLNSMKHADPGLLHLGSSRTSRPSGYTGVDGPFTTDDLDCGYGFSSRPSALTFFCKYTAKNSADRGYAYVAVLDASGNIIASKEISIESSSSYVQKTLTLDYVHNAAKASKIYVKFMSTNNTNALEKNSAWITPPSFGNLNSYFHGSELYIDDVEITY